MGQFGFKGGRIVEPAAGSGHFIGLMPPAMRDASTVTAIEKDPLTARILAALYPDIEVQSAGFEDFTPPNESIDLIIGNVPFGAYKVFDAANRDLSAFPIHNYFIGRSARLIRPGGLLALITTAGTLDQSGREFRRHLMNAGMELAGAVRLPASAFADSGTEVTTDILFLQKQTGGARRFAQNSFQETVTIFTDAVTDETDTIARQIRVNEYYSERPLMMAGEMRFADEVNQGGLYREDRQTLFLADKTEYAERLETALSALPTDIFTMLDRLPLLVTVASKAIFSDVAKIGGRCFLQSQIIREYEALKNAYRQLLAAEIAARPDSVCDGLRDELNQCYTFFSQQFGPLNYNRHVGFLETYDRQYSTVAALENIERRTGQKPLISRSTIFTQRVHAVTTIPDRVDTLEDALNLSLYIMGEVDPVFMAQKTGSHPAEIERTGLEKGYFFRDPLTNELIERASYLSGDVRAKHETASAVAAEDPRFTANVLALEAVIPAPLPIALISFQLGAVWVPLEIINAFVVEVLDVDPNIHYNKTAAEYHLADKHLYSAKNKALGTTQRTALALVEAALNGRSVVVTKSVFIDGQQKEVKDIEATSQAVQAQEALQELFYEFGRANYTELLERTFNETFNAYAPKAYTEPGFSHYPGQNRAITLRKHQFRGVERIKDQDTMLAHVVGSGKTFTMITGAMELKRLGKINKAMIAVQNSTVADFGRAWRTLYPGAIIYVPDKSDMEAKNRVRFLQRIAANNFDGIVIPRSFLKLIPDDPTDFETLVQAEVAMLEAKMGQLATGSRSAARAVKAINQKKISVENKRLIQADRQTDLMLHFGKLGVDYLALDEAHSYKRLGFDTHRRNIKGIDTQGSQDALQAMTKCQTVQRMGGRVVLATGTPISNTMAEAWTMLRYIAPDRLSQMNLQTFDQFAGTFGQIIPSFELTTTGQFKAVDRFARFINVKQLSELYRNYVDVVMNEDIEEFKRDNTLPELKNGAFTQIILPQTDGVADELAHIRAELIAFEKLSGAEKKEKCHIPLVMYGQARKATLDTRLINVSNPDEAGSKVNAVVEKVWEKFNESQSYNGTQLIFCDTFQSPDAKNPFMDEDGWYPNPNFGKPRFNLFTDIEQKLIAKGIPADQIAVVPVDAAKREPYFDRMREGGLRVMLGTSERMGVGVNVQDRLCALHHMDAPNRPTDFEQRNGRAIRQGNFHAPCQWNIPIEIFTYGVDKTLDATAYGRMAIKQRFINQVLRGQLDMDTMEDVSTEDDFSSMSFDQMMATLSGSQYALMYTAQNHELTRLLNQKKNWQRGMIDAQAMVERANWHIEALETSYPKIELESALLVSKFPDEAIQTVEINEVIYTEGWSESLDNLYRMLRGKARRSSIATGHIKINGLTVGLTGEIIGVDYDNKPIIGVTFRWGALILGQTPTAPGMLMSFRAQLSGAVDAPRRNRERLLHNQELATEFGKKLTGTFRREDELATLKARVAELKELMETENAPAHLPDDQPDEHNEPDQTGAGEVA